MLVDAGAVPRLVALTDHTHPLIRFAALFALGNIASGTAEQIQAVLDAGGFARLTKIVHNRTREPFYIAKEATLALTNMVRWCSSIEQKQFMAAGGVIPTLMSMLKCYDGEVLMGCMDALAVLCETHVLQVTRAFTALHWERTWSEDIRKVDDVEVYRFVGPLWNRMAPHWSASWR